MNFPTKSIRALVVDDEAPARRRIAGLLKKDEDFGPVRFAENGIAAIDSIRANRPDVIFLDVQMPGLDGFGVVETIGPDAMPLTIFVTAYDRYAVDAFDLNAVDYLLKPFSDRRYQNSMDRLKQRLCALPGSSIANANAFPPEFLTVLATRAKPGQIWEWITVKSRETTRLILTEDIDWIEATGVYVTVHAKGEHFLYRAGLAAVASRLDPFRFVRIHRSSIVNIKSISSLKRIPHGEFEVKLHDGSTLMMTRTYRQEVEAIIGQRI